MNKIIKRVVAGLSTMALAASMLAVSASAATPTTKQRAFTCNTPTDVSQKTADMYKELNGGKLNSLIVATAQDYPDALSAGYLSAYRNAPIFFYDKSTAIDGCMRYITSNVSKGGTVYLVGGTAVVPASYEKDLKNKGYKTVRLGGSDRYATNLLCLKETSAKDKGEILICSALNYPDALAASATKRPVMIVNPNSISASQIAYLKSGTTRKFTIVGGTAAVTDKVKNQLISTFGAKNVSVDRRGGANRYETCALVMEKYNKSAKTWVVADGYNYQGALVGAALANKAGGSLLLTGNGIGTAYRNLSNPTMKYFINYQMKCVGAAYKDSKDLTNDYVFCKYDMVGYSYDLGYSKYVVNGTIRAKSSNSTNAQKATGYYNMLKKLYPTIPSSSSFSVSGITNALNNGMTDMNSFKFYDSNGVYVELHYSLNSTKMDFTVSTT